MDDLKSLAGEGIKIVETVRGDLTGDGRMGAVLIVETAVQASAVPAQRGFRQVVLMVPDASGRLRQAASNARIVPCGACGGAAGDPYGYTRVSKGSFTIVSGGGSRERWSDTYTFTWEPSRHDWLATHVARVASDPATGKEKRVELSEKDLNQVTFGDFDPSRLPEATLP